MNTPPIGTFGRKKGLFGAQYVEENHFLFPSLKSIEVHTDNSLISGKTRSELKAQAV
jgi:hypothetical protein